VWPTVPSIPAGLFVSQRGWDAGDLLRDRQFDSAVLRDFAASVAMAVKK
jgi:hypothetical protein